MAETTFKIGPKKANIVENNVKRQKWPKNVKKGPEIAVKNVKKSRKQIVRNGRKNFYFSTWIFPRIFPSIGRLDIWKI